MQLDGCLGQSGFREGFQFWDVCDQVCMNLFEKAPLAWQKMSEWSIREEEFVKRAAYALLACLAWHDKKATGCAIHSPAAASSGRGRRISAITSRKR